MASFKKTTGRLSLLFGIFLGVFVSATNCAQAECCGKLDVGPAYVRVNVLESGNTIHTMDMWAIRAEGAYKLWLGLCAKPLFVYAKSSGDQELMTGGLGFGFCFPVTDCFLITPGVGFALGYMKTEFDKKLTLPNIALGGANSLPSELVLPLHITERFHSYSPYVFLEVLYNFTEDMRVCASVQYAWSHTHTLFKTRTDFPFPDQDDPLSFLDGWNHTKSKTEGFNYSAMIERDIGCNWSVNLGAAYSSSLSKEKHGLRAMGAKVGIAKWF